MNKKLGSIITLGMALGAYGSYAQSVFETGNPIPSNPDIVIPKGSSLFIFNTGGDIINVIKDNKARRAKINGTPIIARTKENAIKKFKKHETK